MEAIQRECDAVDIMFGPMCLDSNERVPLFWPTSQPVNQKVDHSMCKHCELQFCHWQMQAQTDHGVWFEQQTMPSKLQRCSSLWGLLCFDLRSLLPSRQ